MTDPPLLAVRTSASKWFPVEHDLRADLTVDSLCLPVDRPFRVMHNTQLAITLFLELTLFQFKPAVIYHKKERINRARINTWSTRFLPKKSSAVYIRTTLRGSSPKHPISPSKLQMWLFTTQTHHPVSSLGLSSTLNLRRRTKSPWRARIKNFLQLCIASPHNLKLFWHLSSEPATQQKDPPVNPSLLYSRLTIK